MDKLKDHCGVFGIYAPGETVAKLAFFGLYSLQHRGQESAGIAVSDGKKIRAVRGLGLTTSVFNEKNLSPLKGFIAISHNRYSTTGSNTINNVQPIIINLKSEVFALAHNGNIVNADEIKKSFPDIKTSSSTDSEIIAWAIVKDKNESWEQKIFNSFNKFKGAYSIVALTKDKLFAFRDPLGFRPLVLGGLNGGFVICSETCALEIIGAKYIRDVKPGELIVIDKKGIQTAGRIESKKKSFCLFEYVYLARPDSILNQELVHQVRQRSGELLSYEAPAHADMVVAVPDSGTSAAVGFSKASGIPFGEVLIKNRYIGRTFIQPEQRMREMGVKIKFNPMKKVAKGKRIIIVDDSIVRGTTIKKIVAVLRRCGAKKIHLRICSPPIKYPCYFGVDTPDSKQLIASAKTVKEIKQYIDADSLEYLSLSSLMKAAHQKKKNLCTACFSGKYPLLPNYKFTKTMLEEKLRKLAVLISNAGTGSNLQAIIDAIEKGKLKAQIVIVISDTEDALGLLRAKKHKIPTLVIGRHDDLTKILKEKYQVDYICLAGWKKIIPNIMIETFFNKILNIHPGLIPDTIDGIVKNPDRTVGLWNRGKFTGKAIKSFLDSKATYAGSTVNFLSNEFDFGPVLARCFEKILPEDTIDRLYGRLKKKEHQIYIQSLIKLCN